ncbi:hypothetical protein Gohar_019799 [Gossypium harknessii]|uniref:Uncharacterized protein n=1 Tax=Gossypium harknessii TaxID=34285 RepID=A0A7J9IEP6_9ROSI|nr:hypothetical protein [Gossypium harknessii]
MLGGPPTGFISICGGSTCVPESAPDRCLHAVGKKLLLKNILYQ